MYEKFPKITKFIKFLDHLQAAINLYSCSSCPSYSMGFRCLNLSPDPFYLKILLFDKTLQWYFVNYVYFQKTINILVGKVHPLPMTFNRKLASSEAEVTYSVLPSFEYYQVPNSRNFDKFPSAKMNRLFIIKMHLFGSTFSSFPSFSVATS